MKSQSWRQPLGRTTNFSFMASIWMFWEYDSVCHCFIVYPSLSGVYVLSSGCKSLPKNLYKNIDIIIIFYSRNIMYTSEFVLDLNISTCSSASYSIYQYCALILNSIKDLRFYIFIPPPVCYPTKCY